MPSIRTRLAAPIRASLRRRRGDVGVVAATVDDVEACYRLLLGRAPDVEGRAHLVGQLPALTVEELVRRFLNSPEFRSRPLVLQTLGGGDELREVDAGPFRIFVRANDQDIGRAITRNRTYEPHVGARLAELLAPGHTFVDVGANVGWFSLLAASMVGPTGDVRAVEANPDNCALIRRSVRLNGVEDIVRIHPVAASDQAATMVLSPQAGSNGIVDDGGRFAAQFDTRLVHALALDDLLHDVARLDVVKIDIEGGEHRAVLGFSDLLTKFRPHVLAEHSPALLREVSGVEPAALLGLWSQLGYTASLLLPGRDAEPVALDEAVLDAACVRAGSDHVDLHLAPA
jgi:FkbM family methyltransferase